MKIHELVEKSIEWVAYDGVLGESTRLVFFDSALVRTLDDPPVC